MRNDEINDVIKLWLEVNIHTHDYISESYWKNNKDLVKEMMLEAEVYVYEDQIIKGFVGLNDTYLAGIFVDQKYQSQGIGKKLLDYVKDKKNELSLSVYQKNMKAIRFYERESFFKISEELDETTEEKEFVMSWNK